MRGLSLIAAARHASSGIVDTNLVKQSIVYWTSNYMFELNDFLLISWKGLSPTVGGSVKP